MKNSRIGENSELIKSTLKALEEYHIGSSMMIFSITSFSDSCYNHFALMWRGNKLDWVDNLSQVYFFADYMLIPSVLLLWKKYIKEFAIKY